jgi:hypothetical protein
MRRPPDPKRRCGLRALPDPVERRYGQRRRHELPRRCCIPVGKPGTPTHQPTWHELRRRRRRRQQCRLQRAAARPLRHVIDVIDEIDVAARPLRHVIDVIDEIDVAARPLRHEIDEMDEIDVAARPLRRVALPTSRRAAPMSVAAPTPKPLASAPATGQAWPVGRHVRHRRRRWRRWRRWRRGRRRRRLFVYQRRDARAAAVRRTQPSRVPTARRTATPLPRPSQQQRCPLLAREAPCGSHAMSSFHHGRRRPRRRPGRPCERRTERWLPHEGLTKQRRSGHQQRRRTER